MSEIKACKDCQETFEKPNTHFLCPNDGLIHQDKVSFLCNMCEQSELIYKDGIYICPKCLTESESFQCRQCSSNKVTILEKGGERT